MEKDQIIILKDRDLVSITGPDSKDFLQNILSNDINKVNENNSIFSAIFTPQGKYLYEFFVIKLDDSFLLDCDSDYSSDIIEYLLKFKLRSKIEIKNVSQKFVIGIISLEKFKEIQKSESKNEEKIFFRKNSIFIDPRNEKLGARIFSNLEKLHLTIKKLNLKIIENTNYLKRAHSLGVPIVGTKNLKDQLFGLEANLDRLNAIDFKKGCFVGQENTARMRLKNKIRRRLLPIKSEEKIKIGNEIIFNGKNIGKILINEPYSFALIKLFDPDLSEFIDKEMISENKKIQIIKSN